MKTFLAKGKKRLWNYPFTVSFDVSLAYNTQSAGNTQWNTHWHERWSF